MSASIGDLLRGTFRRLVASRILPFTWVLLVGPVFLGVPYALRAEPSETPSHPLIEMLASPVAGMAAAVLAFYATWRLTREASDIQGRQGALWAWIGWTILAYLPAVGGAVVIAALASAETSVSPMIAESLVISLLAALGAPLLVHASGCAIDVDASQMGDVWAGWKNDYFTLVISYVVLTLPFYMLGDLASHFGGTDFATHLFAALLYVPATILGTVLTVDAFHRVPQKAQG